jgi:hypothetical protein
MSFELKFCYILRGTLSGQILFIKVIDIFVFVCIELITKKVVVRILKVEVKPTVLYATFAPLDMFTSWYIPPGTHR